MSKKPMLPEESASDIYPNPLERSKGVSMTNPMTDLALAGDMPASRLFTSLPAAVARDIRIEAKREWEEEHRPLEKG